MTVPYEASVSYLIEKMIPHLNDELEREQKNDDKKFYFKPKSKLYSVQMMEHETDYNGESLNKDSQIGDVVGEEAVLMLKVLNGDAFDYSGKRHKHDDSRSSSHTEKNDGWNSARSSR